MRVLHLDGLAGGEPGADDLVGVFHAADPASSNGRSNFSYAAS
jgi:hypothetical protein